MTTPTPPATRPRNPEAERLTVLVDSQPFDGPFAQLLDAALRRECRNVVAEIRPAVDALERLVNSWGGAGFINNRGRYEQAERAFRDGVDALNALSQSGVLDEVAGLSDD